MKRLLCYLTLTITSVCVLSCVTVTKKPELYQGAVDCGQEVTVWESLPVSEHNTYDVTVAFAKGACNRTVRVQDGGGNWTTNEITKARPRVFPRATRIVLQCAGNEFVATNCTYTVMDVRKSPTVATATVNLDTNSVPVPVPCGSTVIAYSTTNTAGADVTILWQPSSTCKISLFATRAGGTTNMFIHAAALDPQLSTIHAVTKLTVKCEGTAATTNSCSFHVVETEL